MPDAGVDAPASVMAVTVFRTGVIPDPRHVPGPATERALLTLPLVGVVVGLVGAGVLATVRQLTLYTMPFESTENLHVASIRGCILGAISVIVLHAGLTGGWHLRAIVPRRHGWYRALGVAGVGLGLLLQATVLAVASWRGHGTLALVTWAVAGQVALLWMLRHESLETASGATRRRVRARPLTVTSFLALTGPLLILAADDDARRPAAPFVLAAIPVAAVVGVGLALVRWRDRRPGDAPRARGIAVEAAMLLALAMVAAAPV